MQLLSSVWTAGCLLHRSSERSAPRLQRIHPSHLSVSVERACELCCPSARLAALHCIT